MGSTLKVPDESPNTRMANKFHEGGVFVAGDAAHVHSPTGGQGLNSIVQDQVNLAWTLALVEKGWASPDLLDTYTEERLPVITTMLQQSTTLLNALETSTASDGTDDVAWKRSRQLKQLGATCGWSSTVVDERAPEKPKEPVNVYGGEMGDDLRAGDRAPDAPGLVSVSGGKQESLSLFHIFRPVYHTALLFISDYNVMELVLKELRHYPDGSLKTVVAYPRDVAKASPEASADITLVDKEGHAFSAHGVSPDRPTIVAIRPDGVVGAIVFGVDGLKAYLEAVFSVI